MKRLKCFFFGHDLSIIRAVSRQAALVKCDRCENLFAAKMEGDCKGHLMPWKKAQPFYEKFSGSLLK